MFLRQPTRPASSQKVFQRFRLADSREGVAQDTLDQFKGTHGNFAVGFYPVTQILAKLGMKHCLSLNVAGQGRSPGGTSPGARACPSAELLFAALSEGAEHSWEIEGGVLSQAGLRVHRPEPWPHFSGPCGAL